MLDKSEGYTGGLRGMYLWQVGGTCLFGYFQNLLRQGNTETLKDFGHRCGHLGTLKNGLSHIPSDLVVACVPAHRKPPDVRICRLRHQSAVGTRPPSTSTPH